jgi:PKD repeat protein
LNRSGTLSPGSAAGLLLTEQSGTGFNFYQFVWDLYLVNGGRPGPLLLYSAGTGLTANVPDQVEVSIYGADLGPLRNGQIDRFGNPDPVYVGSVAAFDVLPSWALSPPDLAVVLDARWKAVGIAREQASTGLWYWSVSFGNVLDCPPAAAAPLLAFVSPTAAESHMFDDQEPELSMVAIGAAAPLAQVAVAPGLLPVAAFVISQTSPMARQPVTVTNVSRDASGHPIGALLNFGDGVTTTSVAAGASVAHSYADAGSVTITLSAADAAGNSLSVARPVVVGAAPTPTPLPADFTFSLAPSSQQLSPGQSTTFIVSVAMLNGFNAPVALSASGLPTGVTASFSPTSVNASDIAVLTIAATNAATASSTPTQFTVSATGGGITHATSGGVTVNFGLLPECFGAIGGTVTDAQSGQRLASVNIRLAGSFGSASTYTDANGHFLLDGLPLGPNNGATVLPLVADPLNLNYFGATNSGVVVACGQVTTNDFALVATQTGTLSGVVHVGIPDPNDLTPRRAVSPTTEVIVGAAIGFQGLNPVPAQTTTAADGTYDSGPLPLGPGNVATFYQVTASLADYWLEQQRGVVQAAQNGRVEPSPRCCWVRATPARATRSTRISPQPRVWPTICQPGSSSRCFGAATTPWPIWCSRRRTWPHSRATCTTLTPVLPWRAYSWTRAPGPGPGSPGLMPTGRTPSQAFSSARADRACLSGSRPTRTC